jgi:hypothetical protein
MKYRLREPAGQENGTEPLAVASGLITQSLQDNEFLLRGSAA